jgi:hypothetical protein
MRLSEFLQEPDIKQAGIRIGGKWKTSETTTYIVLCRGQAPYPITGITHEVLIDPPGDLDPKLEDGEPATIRGRFKIDKSDFSPLKSETP